MNNMDNISGHSNRVKTLRQLAYLIGTAKESGQFFAALSQCGVELFFAGLDAAAEVGPSGSVGKVIFFSK